MSRFSSFFDALSDKQARFKAEKQVVNDLIFDFYFNALQGKTHFDAIVISGGDSGNSAQTIQGTGQDVIAIKVRPIDIQGLALPDPCSDACKGESESYRTYLYALHPTAYSDPNNAESQTAAPGFGSIVKCYFEDRKRFRQLRWTSEGASLQGSYNFACEELGKLVSNFVDSSLLGDVSVQIKQLTGKYDGRSVENGKMKDIMIMTENAHINRFLLPEVAKKFDEMATAYNDSYGKKMATAGKPGKLVLNAGYRDLETQIATKQRKIRAGRPNEAADPGTSKHGWGTAIDVNTRDAIDRSSFGSEVHNWLKANASKYGFSQPVWAGKNGSTPEAHHWEHIGVVSFSDDKSVPPTGDQ